MDLRENGQDMEEVVRATVAGLMKNHFFAMPARVTEDSKDGHVATLQPTIKRAVRDPVDGSTTYEDHPPHPDAPIHHMGGGGISVTHPTSKDDTGTIFFASRAIDSWFQSDGTQQPIEDRMHSVADGLFLSGIRSTPRKLHQVSQESSQTRTDDKKSVIDHGPNGTHHKTVDPSTAAASESFDPFKQATKFFEHKLHPTDGHAVNATDGGTTHSSTLTHADGWMAMAKNGSHSLSAHPDNGTSILSSVAHILQAPNASLDKSGNQTNAGSSTSKGDISSTSGNISAPSGTVSGSSGQFGGGFLGNISFGGGGGGGGGGFSGPPGTNGSLTINPSLVAAPSLQSNGAFTVAELQAQMPAGAAYQGTRVVVTDAMLPMSTDPSSGSSTPGPIAFRSILHGGNAAQEFCGAICLYGTFIDPSTGSTAPPGWAWVAG